MTRLWFARSAQATYFTVLCLALLGALIALILPLVPATPFFLVAAWAAPKGSPRVHNWLTSHKHLSPMVNAWHDEGAVPTSAKWFTSGALVFSWVTMIYFQVHWWILLSAFCLFATIIVFLVTRPAPKYEQRKPAEIKKQKH